MSLFDFLQKVIMTFFTQVYVIKVLKLSLWAPRPYGPTAHHSQRKRAKAQYWITSEDPKINHNMLMSNIFIPKTRNTAVYWRGITYHIIHTSKVYQVGRHIATDGLLAYSL